MVDAWLTGSAALVDRVAFLEVWATTTRPALDAVLATFIMVAKEKIDSKGAGRQQRERVGAAV